jgi:hypothetical protein
MQKKSRKKSALQFLEPKSYVGMPPKMKTKILFSILMLELQTEYYWVHRQPWVQVWCKPGYVKNS